MTITRLQKNMVPENVTENFVSNFNSKAICKEKEVIDTSKRSRLSLMMLLWWKLHY